MMQCNYLYTVSWQLCNDLHVYEVFLLLISNHYFHKEKRNDIRIQIAITSKHKSMEIVVDLVSTIVGSTRAKTHAFSVL